MYRSPFICKIKELIVNIYLMFSRIIGFFSTINGENIMPFNIELMKAQPFVKLQVTKNTITLYFYGTD